MVLRPWLTHAVPSELERMAEAQTGGELKRMAVMIESDQSTNCNVCHKLGSSSIGMSGPSARV